MCIQSAYKEIGDAEMKKSIGFIIPFEIKKQYENIFFFFAIRELEVAILQHNSEPSKITKV